MAFRPLSQQYKTLVHTKVLAVETALDDMIAILEAQPRPPGSMIRYLKKFRGGFRREITSFSDRQEEVNSKLP